MLKKSSSADGEKHVVKKIKVENKLGLHARPAALLVQTITRYECDIMITKGTKKINAKSIMGVMMLAAGPNTVLTFELSGVDVEQAWEAIEALFKRNFDE